MVPRASFESYYGRAIVKQPVWKVPDVPLYLYLGGLAGGSSLLGTVADLTGRPALRRASRLAAGVGALGGVVALVHDLGRPERFLHMLRVAKPTSPLSVGSWVLAPFSGLAAAAAASELTGVLPGLGRLAGAASSGLAPAMTTYTAVLLADTAVPAWHEARRELPFVFAGGALASAGGAALLATAGTDQTGPARRLAAVGAAVELAASTRMEQRLGPLAATYREGSAGAVLRAARALTAVGGLTALISRRSRTVRALAGATLTAGAIATRYGVFLAGKASVADPAYTVEPQRARLQSASRNGPPR